MLIIEEDYEKAKQSKEKREVEKICCGERSKAHDQTIYRQSREQ